MIDDLRGALRGAITATTSVQPEIKSEQTWRHKRDESREIYIGSVHDDVPEHVHPYVHVTRNTSRRTQAIRITTLRRDYRLHREAP